MLDIYNIISTETAHHTNLINFNKKTLATTSSFNFVLSIIWWGPHLRQAAVVDRGHLLHGLKSFSCFMLLSRCLFLSNLQMQYKSLICRVVIFLCTFAVSICSLFSYFIDFSSFHCILGRICKLHHIKIC